MFRHQESEGSVHRHHQNTVSLTEGSVAKGIIGFAVPLLLGQLLQQLYNLADAWVIGNFADNDSFAAVSSGGSLTFLIIGFFNGIAVGGSVIISRYYGARDKKAWRKPFTPTSCSGSFLLSFPQGSGFCWRR